MIDHNIISGIKWEKSDAESLNLSNNLFDYYSISFGIRNVTNIEKALNEAYRVLKTGGKFLCMEFSHVDNRILSKIYDQYSFNFIPKLGEKITGDIDSYKYLVESIRKFPNRDKFLEMLRNSGFSRIKCQKLNFGVVAIYEGVKI